MCKCVKEAGVSGASGVAPVAGAEGQEVLHNRGGNRIVGVCGVNVIRKGRL